MNKKRIILSLLGIGIFTGLGVTENSIDVSAVGMGSGYDKDFEYELPGNSRGENEIDFSEYQENVNLYEKRPTEGRFKSNIHHLKQPEKLGGNGNSGTFNTLSGEHVISGLRTSYDFNMYFYVPDEFEYGSLGVSVPENYYASYSYENRTADVGEEKVWCGGKRHTKYVDKKWHFEPKGTKHYAENKPKRYKEDHETYYWWDYYGDKWTGSNSNSAYIAIEPNTDDNYQGTKAQWWDDKFDRKLEWRYLGYSQSGRVLGNPYFPSDNATNGLGKRRGTMGIAMQNYTGQYPDRTTYVEADKTYNDWDNVITKSAKIQAIQRLMEWDKSFSGSGAGATINGSWQDGPFTAEEWADGLNLVTNPKTETPVFRVSFGRNRSYSYIVAPAVEYGDMILTEMTEYATDGKLIGKFTRDIASGQYTKEEYGLSTPATKPSEMSSVAVGNTYTIKVKVYNNSTKSLMVNPAKLDIGYAINANALKNDVTSAFSSNDSVITCLSKETSIPGRSYATFEYKVEVPETANDNFRMTSVVNKEHNGISADGKSVTDVTDNCFVLNDWGINQFNVYHGDLLPTSIKLIDKNGNEVGQDEMQPGEDYKVKWTYKYNGPDRDKAYKLNFTGIITRYLPQGATDLKAYPFSVTKKLKNGDEMSFESEYITYEIPKLYVTSAVNANGAIGASNDLTTDNKYFLNKDAGNDSLSATWGGNWDIKISNLSVYPINDRPLKDEYITVGVKYDATLSVPNGVKGKGIELDTTDTITIPSKSGGTTGLIAHTHLKEGVNKDVTQIIQIPVKSIKSGSTKESISVYLNSDKRKYEDDLQTQANNKGTTSMTILPPNNPNDFDTNGNAYGCPVDSANNNSWNITHELLSFTGSRKDYYNFQTNYKYSFYHYPSEDTSSYDSQPMDYTESYTIDYVKFKSKFTTDKNYGENGWVNLMDSSESKYAKIKAGYGYELDIQVTYKNDVFGRQPVQEWDGKWDSTYLHNAITDSNTGLRVSNLQTVANLHDDIYVRTSDKKVASATGWYGTSKALY